MPRGPRKAGELPELDLTPIMSILVILIPVLLFAFNFFQIKITEVQAPRSSAAPKKQKDDKEKPLNLTVIVTSKGFAVSQQSELAEGGEAGENIKMLANPPEKSDGYDYATLYNLLVKKKNTWKKEKTINIGAEMDIHWDTVARTLDATRVYLEKESYADLDTYRKAKPQMEDVPDAKPDEETGEIPQRAKPLFETPVFIVAQ